MKALFFVSALTLVACGAGSKRPSIVSGSPEMTVEPTTGLPAGGTLANCGPSQPSRAATLDACVSDCRDLDANAPAGTRCMSPRAACMSQCETQFKK